MQFHTLDVSQNVLVDYQRFFFEQICLLDTSGRESFSTPLPEMPGFHFACVQDTVERLTEETKRLSKFQWRNCLFVPVDQSVDTGNIYMEIFDELRETFPSLFIRSYVYVVFIKIETNEGLFAGDEYTHRPLKGDFGIYYWNTNYDVKPVHWKTDLFKLVNNAEKGEQRDFSNKVFIVSNPVAELKRIMDANSDVIDAARAYLGSLDMVKDTQRGLDEVVNALIMTSGSRVLLRGPARSGKTIVAMSLLSKFPKSKMLLMNWYFYDALKDAFKVWGKMSEEELSRLFRTDQQILDEVEDKRQAVREIMKYADDPRLLEIEIRMREWDKNLELLPHNINVGSTKRPQWQLDRVRHSEVGDYVFVVSSIPKEKTENSKMGPKRRKALEVKRITKLLSNGMAIAEYVFSYSDRERHLRLLDDDVSNRFALQALKECQRKLKESSAQDYCAKIIKDIADALAQSTQRFYHHDKRYDGCWVDKNEESLIEENCLLICDEAQRLGFYGSFDEVENLASRTGSIFLCGDDCQTLNRRGDMGIDNVLRRNDKYGRAKFHKFDFVQSLGIPSEIDQTIKCMLGSGPVAHPECSYRIKLIHNDDPALVRAFENDPSAKKHYALPVSSGFYPRDYVPGIWRMDIDVQPLPEDKDAYDLAGFIPMLSPLGDPRRNKDEEADLSRKYKFFCAEAIMPNYALSAYELISRELESVYLKIPFFVGVSMLKAPLEGADGGIDSWIKRHLYVLMTRATANLVINVEDDGLYDYFMGVCKEACIDTTL